MGPKKHVLPDPVQAGKTADWQTFNWVEPDDTDMVWINGVEYLRVGMLEVAGTLTPEEHQDKQIDWSAIRRRPTGLVALRADSRGLAVECNNTPVTWLHSWGPWNGNPGFEGLVCQSNVLLPWVASKRLRDMMVNAKRNDPNFPRLCRELFGALGHCMILELQSGQFAGRRIRVSVRALAFGKHLNQGR